MKPIMKRRNQSTKNMAAACLLLGMGSVAQAAAISADFSVNSQSIDSLVNSNGELTVAPSLLQKLRYTGSGQTCSDVEWYTKMQGATDWSPLDSTKYAELKLHRAGTHQLKMTVAGRNNWLSLCFHKGEYDERVVSFKVESPGYTQTKHPIMLVPGVMAFDTILGVEYFFGIADMIAEESDQPVSNVSLSAWQNTEDRGADLAEKIIEFLAIHDEDFYNENSEMKVNLIAHSHGATTSRMAINILAKEFGDEAKVASLTTVAGPHYGTPTADGALWAVENWGGTGHFLGETVIKAIVGDFAGAAAAFASGHAGEYGDQEIMQVLEGFTQKGMVRFNTCYPSFGVPKGGKYFIEPPLAGVEPIINLPIGDDGRVSFSDCQEFANVGAEGEFELARAGTEDEKHDFIQVAAIPNDAYGAGTADMGTHIFGDGLGNEIESNAPNAVRYYSFSGKGEWNTSSSILEFSDPALLVINSLFAFPGQRTEEGHVLSWLSETGMGLITGEPVERVVVDGVSRGYTKDSDSFIPIDSARFGEYIGAFGPWNHVDETNGIAGLRDPSSDDPLLVYKAHINRLQQGGL